MQVWLLNSLEKIEKEVSAQTEVTLFPTTDTLPTTRTPNLSHPPWVETNDRVILPIFSNPVLLVSIAQYQYIPTAENMMVFCNWQGALHLTRVLDLGKYFLSYMQSISTPIAQAFGKLLNNSSTKIF